MDNTPPHGSVLFFYIIAFIFSSISILQGKKITLSANDRIRIGYGLSYHLTYRFYYK